MNKSKLLKIAVTIVALAALATGGYLYKDSIESRIARTVAVVSGQEIKPLLDSESRYIRQIVAKDNSTSRTIMWQSDSSEADAVIEYRLVGSDDIKTLSASDAAFTDDGSTTYIHEGTITDLTPDTKYEYRVGYSTDRRSDWYPLETAGAGEYEVLIYPDSQSSDYSGWEQIVKNSAKRSPHAPRSISICL